MIGSLGRTLSLALVLLPGTVAAQARAAPRFAVREAAPDSVLVPASLVVAGPQLPPAWRCRRGDWTVIAGATLAGAIGGWLVAALAGAPLTDDADRGQQQRRTGLLIGGVLGLGVGLAVAYTACTDERARTPYPVAPMRLRQRGTAG